MLSPAQVSKFRTSPTAARCSRRSSPRCIAPLTNVLSLDAEPAVELRGADPGADPERRKAGRPERGRPDRTTEPATHHWRLRAPRRPRRMRCLRRLRTVSTRSRIVLVPAGDHRHLEDAVLRAAQVQAMTETVRASRPPRRSRSRAPGARRRCCREGRSEDDVRRHPRRPPATRRSRSSRWSARSPRLGLKEAKDLVEGAPKVVSCRRRQGRGRRDQEEASTENGATVEIK